MRSLLLIAVSLFAAGIFPAVGSAQTVTGQVIDERTLQPLASAQVFISQLGIGSLTNATGNYTLTEASPGTYTIRVERLGYTALTREVTVSAGATVQVDFSLVQSALGLDRIVVTGTPGGTQRRAVGNVVGTLDLGEVRTVAPILTITDAMSTRVPGLTTLRTGGMAGAGSARLNIRGVSSIGIGNEPIIIIDGVRVNAEHREARRAATGRLDDINPEDIQSIEVIKGPAAATLYGTEASAGVIQIITNRGSIGRPQFDLLTEVGASWLPDPASLIPTNYGRSPTGELLMMNPWQAHEDRTGQSLFRAGLNNRQSLSVRGGTEGIRYFLALNRTSTDGIVEWNWDRKLNGRMNLDVIPTDWINFAVNASMGRTETRMPGDTWGYALRGSPRTAADYGGVENLFNGFGMRGGPLARESIREELYETNRNGASIQTNLVLLPWLQQRLILGIDRTDEVYTNTIPREEEAPNGLWGSAGLGLRDMEERLTELQTVDYGVSATLRLTDRLGIAPAAGFQYNKRRLWTRTLRGDEFALPVLTTVTSAQRIRAGENLLENSTVGVYGQAQVDWDQRIFVTAAVRADENSAFGAEFGAQVYPKLSATWMLSEEGFWRTEWLDPLRLRMAWGAAGRQPDVLDAIRLFTPEPGADGRPALSPFRLGNPDLGPERGRELEVGFDASLFDGRADVEVTRYWKSTDNLIVARQALPSIGFPGNVFTNVGEVKNWGTEVKLDLHLLTAGRVRWDVTTAFATMNNRLEALGEGFDGLLPVYRGSFHAVGYPLSSFFARTVLSAELDSRGVPINAMCDGGTGSDGLRQGGVPVPCSGAPRLYGGSTQDTWTVNQMHMWTLPWDLTVITSVEARGGSKKMNDSTGSRHTAWTNSLLVNTLPLERDPRFMAQLGFDRGPTGYYDGGYASLDEVGVRWAVPSRYVDRLGVSRASISAGVRNVTFLWRQQDIADDGETFVPDPRTTVGDGNSPFHGIQDNQAPLPRQAMVSMRVSF